MYAIIDDRGTQIKVSPGDLLDIDLLPQDGKKAAKKLTFDRVLLVSGDGDGAADIGTPYLDGASVDAEIVEEIRGEKIDVVMYKRRKGQKKKKGHRQGYLRVKINTINA